MRALVVLCVLLAGCEPSPSKPKPPTPPPPPKIFKFQGSVCVTKVNGVATQVTVNLPGGDITLKEKSDLEVVIRSLEVMSADLKVISDQMEIFEKPAKRLDEKVNGEAKISGKAKAS